MNQYRLVTIKEIITYHDDLKCFVFDHSFDSKAGQFVMVWIPGMDEKPISLSSPDRITIKRIGPFTKEIFKLKAGDKLQLRGPFGNGFPESLGEKVIAIGGGCGIAPLFHIENVDTYVFAGKTKEDIPQVDGAKLVAATEDGTLGTKGFVTEAPIPIGDFQYYICGPEIMMKAVAEKLIKEKVDAKNIFISMERYMKCAIGVCGNCSFSGYRVCADGPVFRYDIIKDLPHFNELHRTRTGELVKK
jgi:dihydroorotate dehydrogenase electron transfer subunit